MIAQTVKTTSQYDRKEESTRALVTFAIMAYNQENFIVSAAESALRQQWNNIEIILSDDCSTDATFQRIQEICKNYNGTHTIRTNQNRKTLGVGGHINAIMAMASGKLIIIAAGDDISYPERVGEIVLEWERKGRCAASFYSNYDDMDIDGTIMGADVAKHTHTLPSAEHLLHNNIVVGATHAWSREIFDIFGPLNPCVTHEDRVIAVRAALLNGVHYIPKSLVARRRGGLSAIGNSTKLEARRRNALRYICDMSQSLADFETARLKGLIEINRHADLVYRAGNRVLIESLFLHSTSFIALLRSAATDLLRTAQRIGLVIYKVILSKSTS